MEKRGRHEAPKTRESSHRPVARPSDVSRDVDARGVRSRVALSARVRNVIVVRDDARLGGHDETMRHRDRGDDGRDGADARLARGDDRGTSRIRRAVVRVERRRESIRGVAGVGIDVAEGVRDRLAARVVRADGSSIGARGERGRVV
jgi:hypothetical protein